MGDVVDLSGWRGDDAYDRYCSECGAGNFSWQTFHSDEENHAVVCLECGEYYLIYGIEKEAEI